MNFRRNLFGLLPAAVTAFALAGCSDDDTNNTATTDAGVTADSGETDGGPAAPGNILEVAEGAGSFTTLLAAVEAAGLTSTLEGAGPFTVFAPTDAAFAALPEGALDGLLADTDELSDYLLFHVAPGSLSAATVVGSPRITTALGPWLDVVVDGTTVTINGATVTTTDIQASNGVIHVIDAVLVPPPKLADLVVATEDLSTVETAVIAAELVDTLNGPGPFTVFAPNNAAFAAVPSDALNKLLADRAALTNVLTYHVVPGRLAAADVLAAATLTTVQGGTVAIDAEAVTVNGEDILTTDIQARNGVVHIIGGVLFPAE